MREEHVYINYAAYVKRKKKQHDETPTLWSECEREIFFNVPGCLCPGLTNPFMATCNLSCQMDQCQVQ